MIKEFLALIVITILYGFFYKVYGFETTVLIALITIYVNFLTKLKS